LLVRSTNLFIVSCITIEILTRHLCVCTYLLLSSPHPIFYFSGYTKTE
jgi:hypothetical protein